MKKVLTVGVFDYFHLGHLRLFKRCKEVGDYLIVGVQEGCYIKKFKPKATILYSTEQRMELVGALGVVDEVVVYKSVDKFITSIEFDIFVIGEDQNHSGFQEAIRWCIDNNKEVLHIERTPNISSSEIKKGLND